MRVSFIGDISLNDIYINLYKKGQDPFSALNPLLSGSDFVIGNLESIAKGRDGENELKKPRLTTTTETLNYLNNIGLSVACLAQNHIYDHLEDGFVTTTGFLKENNIKYFGASLDEKEAGAPIILEKNGIKIGLLNYVTKDTNPDLPGNSRVFLNIFQTEKVIDDIQMLKPRVNHVILILHWGGRVEGGLYPDWRQPKLGRKLIDSGADLIIGHHSHTVQPYEIYKGKYIFYSLGNFCFSDYWFDGKLETMPERRMISMIAGITFESDKYNVQTDYFKNGVVNFCKIDNYRERVLRRNKIFKIFLKNRIGWHVYYFHKQLILPFVLFFSRKDLSFKVKSLRFFRYIHKKLT